MNNPRIKNADEAVEKALAGLREVEPSPGLEQGILQAAENAGPVQSSWLAGLRFAIVARGRLNSARSWALPLACAIGILTAFLIGLGVDSRLPKSAKQQARIFAADPNHRAGTKGAGRAPKPAQPDRRVEKEISEARGYATTGTKTREPVRSTRQPMTAEEEIALAEMRAPSHPAPEAPLTEQEKLLLRIVHQGDPQLMAVLNPEVRAREQEQIQAEFQEFVNQSNRGDRE
jgi:hypothetical protein